MNKFLKFYIVIAMLSFLSFALAFSFFLSAFFQIKTQETPDFSQFFQLHNLPFSVEDLAHRTSSIFEEKTYTENLAADIKDIQVEVENADVYIFWIDQESGASSLATAHGEYRHFITSTENQTIKISENRQIALLLQQLIQHQNLNLSKPRLDLYLPQKWGGQIKISTAAGNVQVMKNSSENIRFELSSVSGNVDTGENSSFNIEEATLVIKITTESGHIKVNHSDGP